MAMAHARGIGRNRAALRAPGRAKTMSLCALCARDLTNRRLTRDLTKPRGGSASRRRRFRSSASPAARRVVQAAAAPRGVAVTRRRRVLGHAPSNSKRTPPPPTRPPPPSATTSPSNGSGARSHVARAHTYTGIVLTPARGDRFHTGGPLDSGAAPPPLGRARRSCCHTGGAHSVRGGTTSWVGAGKPIQPQKAQQPHLGRERVELHRAVRRRVALFLDPRLAVGRRHRAELVAVRRGGIGGGGACVGGGAGEMTGGAGALAMTGGAGALAMTRGARGLWRLATCLSRTTRARRRRARVRHARVRVVRDIKHPPRAQVAPHPVVPARESIGGGVRTVWVALGCQGDDGKPRTDRTSEISARRLTVWRRSAANQERRETRGRRTSCCSRRASTGRPRGPPPTVRRRRRWPCRRSRRRRARAARAASRAEP